MTLEEFLVLKAERENILSGVKIISVEVVDGSLYLFYVYRGKEKKIDLSFINSLSDSYELEIWADMLSRGYLLIYLDGGWLIKKDKEVYQLTENTCTCKGSTYKPNIKCKHLIFRDAEIKYKSRQAIEKQKISYKSLPSN